MMTKASQICDERPRHRTTTSLLGLALGGCLAVMIACGGATPKSAYQAPAAPDAIGAGAMPGGGDRRAEIDRFDELITADMRVLKEQRPVPAPNACMTNCKATQMTSAAATAEPPANTCTPGKGETCTQACTLKKSICENAGNICRIAAEIGGNDAYANGKCNEGLASCDAATKRCCNCL